MQNVNHLKGYNYINPDLSIKERNALKELRDELKRRKSAGETPPKNCPRENSEQQLEWVALMLPAVI